MKFKPLNDRILVRRTESADKTVGGLFIPTTAQEKPLEGFVIAVGLGQPLDDGTRRKPAVRPGDKVLIGKYSGTEIKIEDIEHVIVREDDIMGTFEA